MATRWGIDVGTSAHGIAVYRLNAAGEAVELLGVDECIFGEPVNAKSMTTLNSERRSFRLRRRQVANRASRLRKVGHLAEFIGVDRPAYDAAKKDDVYVLRMRAQHEKVSLPELMRVFLHMAKHRGYRGDLSDGTVRKAIEATLKMREENAAATLGELYFHLRRTAEKAHDAWRILSAGKDQGGKLVMRGTFIRREDIESEWNKIFDLQSGFHPELLCDYPIRHSEYFPDLPGRTAASMKEVFHSAIFYQRPIRWDRGSIGVCRLEEEFHRSTTSQPVYQKYRIAKALSDLRIAARKAAGTRRLTQSELKQAFDFICGSFKASGKVKLSALYDELGLSPKEFRFNFESDSEGICGLNAIRGLTTLKVLYDHDCLEQWQALPESVQELTLEFLSCVTQYRDIADAPDDVLIQSLRQIVCPEKNVECPGREIKKTVRASEQDITACLAFLRLLTEQKIFESSDFRLENRRASYSIPALEKLTSGLLSGREEYDVIVDCYPRAAEKRRELRPVREILPGTPVVDRALVQLERMIKYTLNKFGRPEEIVVELSRDMNNSLMRRSELETSNKKTEKCRAAAAQSLKEYKITASRSNIDKYILWKELSGGKCPYCGKALGKEDVFGHGAEIDHIIPQGGGGADLMSNKLLCCRRCNEEKGKRTPYLWSLEEGASIKFSGATAEYAALLESKAAKMKKAKTIGNAYEKGYAQKAKNLLTEKSIEELCAEFSERQNVQTAWIGKIVIAYLEDICDKVSPGYGKLTAHVRHQFGLDTLLPELRLQENLPLYNKSGKEVDGAFFRKLFLDCIAFDFLTDAPKDAASAAVQKKLQEIFAVYSDEFAASPNYEPDMKRRFYKMLGDLRRDPEQAYYKRCDHRHHIVDAAVIGLCSRAVMNKANEFSGKYGDLYYRDKDKQYVVFKCDGMYCGNLRFDLKRRLFNYAVWHKPDHYPSGSLCDATAYGVMKKDGVARFTRHADVKKIFAGGPKAIETLVACPETRRLMLKACAEGRDEFEIRGNPVRRVKVFYKEKSLIEYDEERDMRVEFHSHGKTHVKYYQNGGYACCDFDRKTGKCKALLTLAQYRRMPLPDDVVRVFAGDIVYDRKEKRFFKIRSFKKRDGLLMVDVRDANPDAKTWTQSNICGLVLIERREQIAELRKNVN